MGVIIYPDRVVDTRAGSYPPVLELTVCSYPPVLELTVCGHVLASNGGQGFCQDKWFTLGGEWLARWGACEVVRPSSPDGWMVGACSAELTLRTCSVLLEAEQAELSAHVEVLIGELDVGCLLGLDPDGQAYHLRPFLGRSGWEGLTVQQLVDALGAWRADVGLKGWEQIMDTVRSSEGT